MFKEYLSIAVPPLDSDLFHERSYPHSPTERGFPSGGLIFSHRSSPFSRSLDLEKGSTGDPGSSPQQLVQPSVRDRLVRLFPVLRLSRTRNDDTPVKRPVWRHGQGHVHCDCRVQPSVQTRRQVWYCRALHSVLVIFLLYLFRNVVVLDVRLYTLSQAPPQASSATSPAPASPPTNTIIFSTNVQQCITQYTLNAPGNPTGYPCDTCLSLLALVPSNATAYYAVARDAKQFCGLRSIWEGSTDQHSRARLEDGGWIKDVKFCTWSGVRCNGDGRVSSLLLISPAVPASLPEQFTNLTALESLKIVGNGNSPAGSFPTTFGALTKLTSLHLENTALGTLPDTVKTLTSLTLIHNRRIGSSLPPSIGGSALRSLIVNVQQLTLSAAQSAALCDARLRKCDLRGSGIKACGACLVS